MKLIFAGTPVFAAVALEALLAARHEVALVLTQPDRPAGRGLQPHASAVKQCASAHDLPLAQPASLKEPMIQQQLQQVNADAMVVAAYGLILPAAVLTIPHRGCFNIHASLLPRWRGAAPIQRALLAGDTHTGITIMQMDAGLDTGAMLLQEKIVIEDADTAQSLHDKLAALGAQLMVQALGEPLSPQTQNNAQATYADKIRKEEAVIDWSQPATQIARKVRAFNPAPGAATVFDGSSIKIWQAQILNASAVAGTVLTADAQGIAVACGTGALRIEVLQKAGAKRMRAADFLAGSRIRPGSRFGA
jgi:methionyl-tRNA formyltransferase